MRKNRSLISIIDPSKKNNIIVDEMENEKNEILKKSYLIEEDKNDESFEINDKSISNYKNRIKNKNYGDNSISFDNSIKIIKNIIDNKKSEIKFIKKIQLNSKNSFELKDMKKDNFIFIYYDIRIICENIENIYQNIGLDTCYKIGKETNGRTSFNIPTITFNSINKNLNGICCFICNCIPFNSNVLSIVIVNVLNRIEKIYKKMKNEEKQCLPLFTIDKGSIETKSLKFLDLKFVHCIWHFFKSVLKHCCNVERNIKFQIIFYLKKIIASKNADEFALILSKFENFCDKVEIKKFYNYFIKTWGGSFDNLTQKFKMNSFSLLHTDNISEYQFKIIEMKIFKTTRIDTMLNLMIKFLKTRYKQLNNSKYKPQFYKNFNINLELSNNYYAMDCDYDEYHKNLELQIDKNFKNFDKDYNYFEILSKNENENKNIESDLNKGIENNKNLNIEKENNKEFENNKINKSDESDESDENEIDKNENNENNENNKNNEKEIENNEKEFENNEINKNYESDENNEKKIKEKEKKKEKEIKNNKNKNNESN